MEQIVSPLDSGLQITQLTRQVLIRFPSPHVLRGHAFSFNSINDTASPVRRQFEKLLTSGDSALRFWSTNESMITKLVVLDLLRTSVDMWYTFLLGFRYKYDAIATKEKDWHLPTVQEDAATHAAYLTTVKDLSGCVMFLLEVIANDIHRQENIAGVESQDWKLFKVEITLLTQGLERAATETCDRTNRLLSSYIDATNQWQAKNASILAMVASIFLPLTLTSSLLAMEIPARDIGGLWYDWVGMSLTVGFVVLAGMYLWNIPHDPMLYFRTIRARIFGFLVFATVVASFLAGMFATRHIAVEILKYGIPGSLALALLAIVLPMLFKYIPIVFTCLNVLISLRGPIHRLGGSLWYLLLLPMNPTDLFPGIDESYLDPQWETRAFEARQVALKAIATTKAPRQAFIRYGDQLQWVIRLKAREAADKRFLELDKIAAEDPEIRSMIDCMGALRKDIAAVRTALKRTMLANQIRKNQETNPQQPEAVSTG
jgi:hypothetical protein